MSKGTRQDVVHIGSGRITQNVFVWLAAVGGGRIYADKNLRKDGETPNLSRNSNGVVVDGQPMNDKVWEISHTLNHYAAVCELGSSI